MEQTDVERLFRARLEEKLQRALAKLEEGSYGKCDRCGRPIALARLAAVPESALCIECAR